MECLRLFDDIVPSVASVVTKQHSIRGGKYLSKTPGNANSETTFQNVPICLGPQELVPLVRVLKPPTNHYQPVTRKLFDSPARLPNTREKRPLPSGKFTLPSPKFAVYYPVFL